MTAAGTSPEVPLSTVVRSGRRPRRAGIVAVVVALAVVLLAEGAVRLYRSELSEPMAWPSPEFQTKYSEIQQMATGDRRPDVVLVGDSMMNRAGDPTGLGRAAPGLRFYNASIPGMTLPVIADWTTRIVQPRLRPKLVVIGFPSNELNPAVLAAEVVGNYRASRAVRVASGTAGPIDRADDFLREHSMLYRYRAELRRPLSRDEPPELLAAAMATMPRPRSYDPGSAYGQFVMQRVKTALQRFEIGLENIEILQDMIRRIRGQGARVLLVAMPVTADLVRSYPKGEADDQAGMNAFAVIADRTRVAYARPEPVVWSNGHFVDPVHVNGRGQARFTSFLAPLVVREASKAGLTTR